MDKSEKTSEQRSKAGKRTGKGGQTDRQKVSEIQEIEDLLFRIEQYKAANNIR